MRSAWLIFPILILAIVNAAFADDLSENDEILFSSGSASVIAEKAAQLGSVAKIYAYVRNNYDYIPYHGAHSDSLAVFRSRKANDVDLATLLIAMLRSRNIPARYATGTIRVRTELVMSSLGVSNPELARNLLMTSAGLQNVSFHDGQNYLEFEHAWVEALVSYSNYRGAGPDGLVPCATNPSRCRWISLDPSFKPNSQNQTAIDVHDVPACAFDYDAYYNAMKNGNHELANKNPLEIFEEQVLAYLRSAHPGKNLEDVSKARQIITEQHDILPASLPYEVISTVHSFDSVAERDQMFPDPPWTKTLSGTITLLGDPNDPIDLHFSMKMSKVSAKPFSVTFDLRYADYKYVDLNLGEEVYWFEIPASYPHMQLEAPFQLDLSLNSSPVMDLTSTHEGCVVGGQYMVAMGGVGSSYLQLQAAKDRLLALNDLFPIVYGPENPPEPYVDVNGSGAYDSEDVKLIDHYEGNKWMTNGLLYAAQTLYYAKLNEYTTRAADLNHCTAPIEGFLGVLSTVDEVEYLDNTPFAVMPGGLLIDVKEQVIDGPWRINQAQTRSAKAFELMGHIGSSLEHETWQEITSYDAISTVRGIQMALADGTTQLGRINYQTIANSYPQLGFSNTPTMNAVTYDTASSYGGYMGLYYTQFNKQFRGYWTNLSPSFPDATMEVIKKTVDTSTPALRQLVAVYPFSAVSNLTNVIDGYFANLNGLYFNSGSTVTNWNTDRFQRYSHYPDNSFWGVYTGTYYDFVDPPGPLGDGSASTLWELFAENLYFFYQDYSDLMDYFDIRKGYVESQYAFRRQSTITDIDYSAGFVAGIRDDVCSYYSGNYWHEYVIPSRKPHGPFFRFVVYVWKAYDKTTNFAESMQFIIQNDYFSAGGGYVEEGGEALDPAEDTTGQLFNNEVFTNQNLIGLSNNDLTITPSTVDPVSTVTGNMYHDETDITIKGRGIDYAFTRTYNSGQAEDAATDLPISRGWTHSYNMSLKANDYSRYPNYPQSEAPENGNDLVSSVTFRNERGGEVNYLVNGEGGTWTVTRPRGVFDTLALNTPSTGQHTVTFRNGTKYIFQGIGGVNLHTVGQSARLMRIEDPYGNRLDLSYDGSGRLQRVYDNLGISGRNGLTFTYYADGRLHTVYDWTGRTWTYGYADGRLTSVTNPLNQTRTYTYHDGSYLLKELTLPADRDGWRASTTFGYYENNRALDYQNTLGHTETLDYDLYRKRTRVTDPRGFIREYSYDKDGALIKLQEPDEAVLLFDNNEDGLRYQKIDALGYSTNYSYRTDRTLSGGSDTGGNVSLERDPLNYEVEYDYGLFDQVIRVQDKKDNERFYTYYQTTAAGTGAVRGKLEKVEAMLGGARVTLETYTYYDNGNLQQKIEFIDPADPTRRRITDYTYDTAGLNLTEAVISGATSGGTVTVTYTYDSLGRKKTETLQRRTSADDPTLLSLTTTYDYDNLGRPYRVTDPLGNISETIFDANGKVHQTKVHHKQPDGSFDVRTYATRTYDAADRLVSETDIYGHTATYEYDASGNLIQTTDANGHITQYEYDPMGRRTAGVDANSHRTETRYDLAGRVVQSIDANGNAMQFAYDAMGRKTKDTTPLGYETQYQYDANGNLTHMTDANAVAGLQPKNSFNATVYNEYDEFNRLTRTVDALNGETTYTYDLLGNMTAITDAKGQTTEFVYDDLGRLAEVIDPIVESPTDATVTFTYDQAGNLQTRTDRLGRVTHYTYDRLNRLVLVEYLNDAAIESFTYDAYGDLTTVANDAVTYSYTYDLAHRMTSKTDDRLSKNLAWQYDAVGNVTRKTDYQNEITYFQYDSTNRLIAERNPAYLQVSYHYDPAGRLLNRILSNRARTDYAYDDDNRLTGLTNVSAGDKLSQSQTYTHDRVGNILSVTDAAGTVSHTYDALYRLTVADYPGTADDQAFTYDAVGNRLTHTTASGTRHYIYNNAGNRLDEVRQGSTGGPIVYRYAYDDAGNRIEKRDGANVLLQSCAYDQKNRITTLDSAAVVKAFAYDPNDYRIEKDYGTGTNRYLMEGEHYEAIYDETGAIQAKFLRGVVVDEIVNGYYYDGAGAKTNYTFHHDHLQSVVGLSGHNGDPEQTVTYGPFGEQLSTSGSSPNMLGYTGRELDSETGLYYYRARYYDPEIGRFLNEDPLGFEAGINFYAYCSNNPINFNDPDGLDPAKLNQYAQQLLNNKNLTDVERLSLAMDFAQQDNQGNVHAAMSDLTDVLAGPIPGIRDASPWVNGFGATGFKPEYVDAGNQVRHFVGSLGAGYYLGLPLGTAAVYAGELRARQPLTGPDVNLGIQGVDMGANLNKIDNWGDTILQELAVPSIATPQQTPAEFDSSFFQLEYPSYSDLSFNTGASGGYVLYPNKPNSNMMSRVYRK